MGTVVYENLGQLWITGFVHGFLCTAVIYYVVVPFAPRLWDFALGPVKRI